MKVTVEIPSGEYCETKGRGDTLCKFLQVEPTEWCNLLNERLPLVKWLRFSKHPDCPSLKVSNG